MQDPYEEPFSGYKIKKKKNKTYDNKVKSENDRLENGLSQFKKLEQILDKTKAETVLVLP